MTDYKKDPLRSQARRNVLKAIGENDIINKDELAKITNLSPLTINTILREFRNYRIVTCHSGGLYALSGEGKEVYYQMINDKRYRKKAFERRMDDLSKENKRNIHTIQFDDIDKATSNENDETNK